MPVYNLRLYLCIHIMLSGGRSSADPWEKLPCTLFNTEQYGTIVLRSRLSGTVHLPLKTRFRRIRTWPFGYILLCEVGSSLVIWLQWNSYLEI